MRGNKRGGGERGAGKRKEKRVVVIRDISTEIAVEANFAQHSILRN